MKPADLFRLLLLAAIWGASFLFMRIAAPAFGSVNTTFLRVFFALVGGLTAAVGALAWFLVRDSARIEANPEGYLTAVLHGLRPATVRTTRLVVTKPTVRTTRPSTSQTAE